MATEYRFYGFTSEDDCLYAQILVGKNARLERLPVDRKQAYGLLARLAHLLAAGESD